MVLEVSPDRFVVLWLVKFKKYGFARCEMGYASVLLYDLYFSEACPILAVEQVVYLLELVEPQRLLWVLVNFLGKVRI